MMIALWMLLGVVLGLWLLSVVYTGLRVLQDALQGGCEGMGVVSVLVYSILALLSAPMMFFVCLASTFTEDER